MFIGIPLFFKSICIKKIDEIIMGFSIFPLFCTIFMNYKRNRYIVHPGLCNPKYKFIKYRDKVNKTSKIKIKNINEISENI